MTPDELRELCTSGKSPGEFAEAVSHLDEATRKKLSATAQKIVKEARAAVIDDEESGVYFRGGQAGDAQLDRQAQIVEQARRIKQYEDHTTTLEIGRLALLAVGPVTQAKKACRDIEDYGNDDVREAFVRILKDRRPDWADQWINEMLDGIAHPDDFLLTFGDIRELFHAGVIQRPTSDGYIQMLSFPPGTTYESECNADILAHDIWRLFEIDTWMFQSIPPLDEIPRSVWASVLPSDQRDMKWPRTLFYLSEQGAIDRGRLIDATLAAFWMDFGSSIVTGLTRFHDLLAPTDDEIAERQAAYRDLLRRDAGIVVTMSLNALERLHKAKRLDVEAFLGQVPAVFDISAKVQPKAALTLMDRATKQSPEQRVLALAAMERALNHDSPDIQERAIKLLAGWKKADASLDLSSLPDAATQLAPQHRTRLNEIAGAPAEGASTADTASDLEEREQSIRQRLEALPAEIRQLTCPDGLAEAAARGELPPVFDPPPECPVLSGLQPIEPIQDIEELIEAVERLVQAVDSPDDVEHVIDGIMRLGGETTENIEEKTAGIRGVKIRSKDFRPSHFSQLDVACPNLLRLIQLWMDYKFKTGIEKQSSEPTLLPIDARVASLLPRFAEGRFGPSLAVPTHSEGWIDPRVFVERLSELQSTGVAIGRADFICGLMRLAPDFQDEAREAAEKLSDPHCRIVCYALGANETPKKSDSDLAEEWLAAARSRSPDGVLDELRPLNSAAINEADAGSILPAKYACKLDCITKRAKGIEWQARQDAYVTITPDRPTDDALALRPSVASSSGRADWLVSQKWMQSLITNQWPANCNSTLAAAYCNLTSRMHDPDMRWFNTPADQGLSPLFRIDRGWSELGRVVLWLAMLCDDEQGKGTAVDALIEGIADGRADAEQLGETLLTVGTGEWIKLNRLVDPLREVTRTSLLAERVVAQILDRLIASWDALPRDGHHVLSLQVELLTHLEGELSKEARTVLSDITGRGKAAKLAKQLCELKASAASQNMRAAAMEAAEGRLARAERIAKHAGK